MYLYTFKFYSYYHVHIIQVIAGNQLQAREFLKDKGILFYKDLYHCESTFKLDDSFDDNKLGMIVELINESLAESEV